MNACLNSGCCCLLMLLLLLLLFCCCWCCCCCCCCCLVCIGLSVLSRLCVCLCVCLKHAPAPSFTIVTRQRLSPAFNLCASNGVINQSFLTHTWTLIFFVDFFAAFCDDEACQEEALRRKVLCWLGWCFASVSVRERAYVTSCCSPCVVYRRLDCRNGRRENYQLHGLSLIHIWRCRRRG